MKYLIPFIILFSSCQLFVDDNKETEYPGVDTVKISVKSYDLEKLQDSVYTREYTDCFYRDREKYSDAEIKVRGDHTREDPKKSFTIQLNENYKYAMNSTYRDESHMRNRVSMYLYRLTGLSAPLIDSTALYINSSFLGYYSRIKMYNKNNTGVSSPELYKINMNFGSHNYPIYGETEKKIPDNDNYSTLINFLGILNNSSDEEWKEWFLNNADIDKVVKYISVQYFLEIGDTDTKNHFILFGPKFSFLPWDNDKSLRNSSETYNLEYNYLIKRILSIPEVMTEFKNYFRESFINSSAISGELASEVIRIRDEISDIVRDDPLDKYSHSLFLSQADSLVNYISGRADNIKADNPYGF